MTKVIYNSKFPAIDRDEFLTPFDRMFDQIINTQFPEIEKQVGVKPFSGTAYPKVNVYEYDDKVGIIAEIPGLDKKDLKIDVDEQPELAKQYNVRGVPTLVVNGNSLVGYRDKSQIKEAVGG